MPVDKLRGVALGHAKTTLVRESIFSMTCKQAQRASRSAGGPPKQPNVPRPRHTPAPVSSLRALDSGPVVVCLRVSIRASLACRLLGARYVGAGGPGAVCVWCWAGCLTWEEAGRGLKFSRGRYYTVEVTKHYTSNDRYFSKTFSVSFPKITATLAFGITSQKGISRKKTAQTLYSKTYTKYRSLRICCV